jgi:nucleoside-diphosphate-sugar epimerase
MIRIAVIGANGQVGAELCLLLADAPDIKVVPICRNRSGSAYLRYLGVPCRHGRVADPVESGQLLADVDLIVNSALPSGTPRRVRDADRRILGNLCKFAKPGAPVIHFSTLMVYGDPRPRRMIRWRDPYARAKLASERFFLAEARRTGRPGYVLRLGHVCGELQNISALIRARIASGAVILPARDAPSNTVYTVTIADAIVSIAIGSQRPGVYDLTNSPQWTWRDVYEQESANIQATLLPIVVNEEHTTAKNWLIARVRRHLGDLLRLSALRHTGGTILAHAPESWNARAQALWFVRRARSEIEALTTERQPAPELSWPPLGRRHLGALTPTRALMARYRTLVAKPDARSSWPDDVTIAPLVNPCKS